MSAPEENGGKSTVTKRSQGRYRVKSEGRARSMRELNARGLRGPGGAPVKKGDYALADRYKAGVNPQSPLYPILRQHRDDFLSDLGGEASASSKEVQDCEFLGFLKILFGLQVAQLSQAKRMSRRELAELTQAVTRTASTFSQIAKTLGLKRRQVEADRTVVVRRYGSDPEAGKPEATSSSDARAGSSADSGSPS